MPLLIQTEVGQSALMRPQSLFHPFRKPATLLSIPRLSADENATWSLRLEYLRRQCGCTAAAIGLGGFTLSSFVYVLAAALQMNPATEPDHQAMLFKGVWFFAGLILSALLGKLVGLTFAALRLRQTCRALQTRLETLPGPTDLPDGKRYQLFASFAAVPAILNEILAGCELRHTAFRFFALFAQTSWSEPPPPGRANLAGSGRMPP